MKEGLEALNVLVDKVLAYRPKQKTKPKKVKKKFHGAKPVTAGRK